MKPVAFAPAARDEFQAAAEWYESHADGLGVAFVNCIDDLVLRIGEAPSQFPAWEGDRRFRKAVAQRFPYVVFYRELPDRIHVLAIAHGAREPGYWLKRK
jgi:plasmid stabilization system protein ParE